MKKSLPAQFISCFYQGVIYVLMCLLLLGCGKKEFSEKTKPTVLVTIAPYAYVVEKIAGDTIQVEILVPPGMNLHIFEPTPRQVERSSLAELWFQIKEPFEEKITRVFQEKNPNQKRINLQEGISLLGHDDVTEVSPCVGSHAEGGEDLHTWLSPKIMKKQAKKIALELQKLLPKNTAFYKKNFDQLEKELQSLDISIAQRLKPFQEEAILVSHPALGYFCRDYDLIQLSVECEGKEPKPRDVQKILQRIRQYTVKAVFLQQGFNNRGAALIAKRLHLETHLIDPYAKDYVKNMNQIANYIQ